MGRLRDLRQPELAVEHRLRNTPGAVPHIGFFDDVAYVVTGEGELAGEMAVLVLVDHAAHRVRVIARENPVHDDLRNSDLAAHLLATRLEVNGLREALFRLAAG